MVKTITDEQAINAKLALDRTKGNKTKAALDLGLPRSTFRDHLKAFEDRGLKITPTPVLNTKSFDPIKRAETLISRLVNGAAAVPNGFRDVPFGKRAGNRGYVAKAKRPRKANFGKRNRFPTLLEKLSMVAYDDPGPIRERSGRGESKRRARDQHIARSKNFQRRLEAYRADVGNPVASFKDMNRDWGTLTDLQYLEGDIHAAA